MSIQSRILLSRFLTRFGDQAWDFSIPLVLISLFPGQIQNVAGYFLISKVAQFFMNPIVLRWIDHLPRKMIYKLGIGSQTLAVVLTWVVIGRFHEVLEFDRNYFFWLLYLALGLVGIIGALGSNLMEISVGYDLAADQVPKDELAVFNSRLKRIDLFTEVVAPIFAGATLQLWDAHHFNIGFTIIAALNLVTFLPEYILLSTIKGTGQLKTRNGELLYVNPIQEFRAGITDFKDATFVIPMIAYAFLWLSVLSPHGVLLAGYLKDGAKITEFQISIFRGLGAFFGMVPTFLFPFMKTKWGLVKSSKVLLGGQALCVTSAALVFQAQVAGAIYWFLFLVLLSRIGLYGYSIAESEVRQKYIPNHLRGRINGVGVSLTSFATLVLFGVGTLLPTSNDFTFLVRLSAASVVFGFLAILKWQPKSEAQILLNR